MESLHCFKIYYGNVYVLNVTAHTKWEAIDKAYYKFISNRPDLERKNFNAKKNY
jgi:hypothetical protein